MVLQDRAILVKNDDTSITYIGNWTTVEASAVNNLGNFGPAFSPTLHSSTTVSSFTFPFDGSSIAVFGTINIANASTDPNPTWQCVLDGVDLGSPNIFQFPENNWALCSQENIPDGSHELVVNVTSKGRPFYLDYIHYQPSSNVSLENSLIVIQNDDSEIDYISGWGNLGETANQTTDPSGLVNVTFVGTQLSWYGFIPTEEPHKQSSGEFSIDGQPFVSFQLVGLPSSSSSVFNQLFFATPNLKMGSHTLSAKYTGGPGQTPFTLDYLVVTNGSFPSKGSSHPNSSGGGGKSTSNSTPSAPPTKAIKKSSSHVGSIVGGVVGAIAGIVICSIIVFFWLKSRKRRRTNSDNEITRRSTMEPFSTQPQFIPNAAPLMTSGPIYGTSYAYQPESQPDTSQTSLRYTTSSYLTTSSSNDLTSPITSHETSGGLSGRPLPSLPPPQFIPSPSLRKGPAPLGGTTVRAPIQHEDSGIRLSPPVILQAEKSAVEIPPTYFAQNQY